MRSKDDWIKHWNYISTKSSPKEANGRGGYTEDVFETIYKDIIKILNIDKNSTLLDVGGGTGYFLTQIINECNISNSYLIDSSVNSIEIYKKWVMDNNISNSKSIHSVLPDITIDKNIKFNKIMCGTALGYLSSMEEVRESIQEMYNFLTDDGKLLLFHHWDKKSSYNEVLTFDYQDFLTISEDIGFKNIKRVVVGKSFGAGCCGTNEISVLLSK